MNAYAVLLLSVIIMGCSSVSNVSYPLSDGTFMNQRTIADPHAFSPTHTRSFLETCTASKDDPKVPDYSDCYAQKDERYATSTGFLDGLGAAALYSGAIVGGSALIGNGIAQSGSHVNQSSSGGNANNTSIQQNTPGRR